ncbi:MAG: hypothetical protein Q4G43_00135 [Mobilicoccus sp.]|nr:hypothetical protein [Mobilicoccus sp.]
MVEVVLTALVVALVLNVLVSLVRVVRGPTGRDRLTGVLFAGTTGAGALATSSVLLDVSALRDIALAIVALAAVVVVVRWAAEHARSAA